MKRHLWVVLAAIPCGLSALPLQAPSEVERRVIAVNVLDRDGNQVPGLGASDFRGEFRGQQVKILAATADTFASRIAVALDTSASMGEQGQTLALGGVRHNT